MPPANQVAVVIPWSRGCRHRQRALKWVLGRWRDRHPDWSLIVQDSGPGPWCKPATILAAAEHTDAETLVIADADVWCDRIGDAVHELTADPDRGWAVPHRMVHRLNRDATAEVLAGTEPDHSMPLDRAAYLGHPFGGLVVVTRPMLELVPDPRFIGWGHEDDAAARALTTMVGPPIRPNRTDGPAPLWHLWHPPQPTKAGSNGPKANRDLWKRYRARTNDRARMAALIKEGRT